MKIVVVLVLAALVAVSYADNYQINNTVVAEQKYRGLQRTVKELRNTSNRSIRFYYSLDKELCFSWNVSASILDKFNLGRTTSGCSSTGSYTTSGYLSPGYTVEILGQAFREYTTYLAERIRVRSDGSWVVVDSTYATKRLEYEDYWSSIHR